MHWVESAPLWLIGLLILIGLIIAEQIGYAGRRITMRGKTGDHSNDSLGYLVSAALALLGLLIAFTFGQASDRFNARRLLVLAEANAIGTTYLRIQALDEAPKAALSALMVQYAVARKSFFDAGEDAGRLQQSEDTTGDLQDRIWALTVGAVRANPTATINVSLLQTTNDMFDLAASRRTAQEARLPITILRTLILYAFISAAIIGYSLAQGPRQIAISVALFVALALALTLILDLDRPRRGTVTVGQAPLIREIASLQKAEAAKPAVRPPAAP